MEAITNHNIELVQLLLEYHADLDIKDSDGSTPLALAKETGAKEIENLLLQWMKQKIMLTTQDNGQTVPC